MTNPTRTLTVMLAIVGLAAAACKPKAGDYSNILYVAPKDGLNLRDQPSITGRKLVTIPRGAQVQKLEEKPDAFRIDNIEGKWTKISWQGKTGWVFGGFLSSWVQTPRSGSASDSSAPQNETAASDDSQCRNKCEQEHGQSQWMCESCGRFNNVCDPEELRKCLAEATEKKDTCLSKC